ncbi:MAG: AraC family transcriptional regulator [Ruminococcaceae bacterium]|nr:AraC family transcriptional regulator [Oscillospiraceae bacterium]
MFDLQYARIETKTENMEFIINRSQNVSLSKLAVTEMGHSKPVTGKRADEISLYYQLHFVVSGKGLFRGSEISEGTAFLVVPGESQGMSVESDNFEQYWINFDGSEVPELLQSFGIPIQSHTFDYAKNESGKRIMISLFDSIFPKCPDDAEVCIRRRHAYLVGILYQLLSIVDTSTTDNITTTDRYIASVCSYIRSHYSQELTVSWLAAVAGLSPKYLIRIFKQVTGMTIIGYITKTRLETAQSLLRTTSKSIGETAQSVGYTDALYFSKVFKTAYGMSPSEFRNTKQHIEV